MVIGVCYTSIRVLVIANAIHAHSCLLVLIQNVYESDCDNKPSLVQWRRFVYNGCARLESAACTLCVFYVVDNSILRCCRCAKDVRYQCFVDLASDSDS